MNRTMIRTTILTLAALAAVGAVAGDLPAEAPRIWAPTGDEIGLDNHATASVQVLDEHGSEAKGAEDWQLLGKTSGSLLLGWHNTWDSGYAMDARAYGTNEAGGLGGRYGLWGSKPGHGKWSLVFRNNDQYADPTSEMRAPSFKYDPAPPALPWTPHLEWRMTDLALGYRLGDRVNLALGLDRRCREGTKGSLLRSIPGTGAAGPEVPGTRSFDTTSNEIWLGGDYSAGALAADLRLAYRAADGDRTLDTRQSASDDQQAWQVLLNAGYELGARTTVLGGFAAANLQNNGSETRATLSEADAETKTTSGRLGLVTGLGRGTSLRVFGLLQDQQTDARQDDAGGVLQAVDRQRTRQEFLARLDHTGLPRTRLQLQYRYRQTDLDETTSEGDLPGGPAAGLTQAVLQDGTRQDLALKGRSRLGRGAQLRARVAWQQTEITENTSGDDWLWVSGDRDLERLAWELALQTRPARTLKLDLGWRGWDQTLTRSADGGSETGWQANTLYANLNWYPHERATLYGTVSTGVEQVDLTGAGAPSGTMGPVAYDGTTLRFTPGATLRVLPSAWLDAMYEGIRFEDTADQSAALDALNSDQDRVLLRARWNPRPDRTVAATYRRQAFDENRWDDFIQDIWQLSVSGRF